MKKELDGRLAVVTGAGAGIGRAIAATLAGNGAAVAIADVNVEAAQQVAAELRASGGTAAAFEVDVAAEDSVRALQRRVAADMGLTDIIVNCAGWNIGRPFLENEPEFMDKVNRLNLMGPIYLCQAFLEPLVAEGLPGRVVNISSDAGRVGSLGETVYAAAKGGVIAFTKSLAREMARHQITVNCVCPGPTDTDLFRAQPEKIQGALIRAIPMRRPAQPGDIANAVAFFAGPGSGYVTGQVLSVSGGLTMVG